MSEESLQAEVDRLRSEIEAYRAREVADLKSALAVARQDIAALRQECNRISQAGQSIAAGYQEEIQRLRSQLEIKDQVSRQLRRTANGNASRN